MKTLLLIIYSTIVTTNLIAQCRHINCIIFVDGKLPGFESLRGDFKLQEETKDSVTINFTYSIGEIKLTDENWSLLNSLPSGQLLTINLRFKPYEGSMKFYSKSFSVDVLRYEYLILRITNLKKKKGGYYFGVTTPYLSSVFIKEEYDMFDE